MADEGFVSKAMKSCHFRDSHHFCLESRRDAQLVDGRYQHTDIVAENFAQYLVDLGCWGL